MNPSGSVFSSSTMVCAKTIKRWEKIQKKLVDGHQPTCL
jgi:hypothetical protein